MNPKVFNVSKIIMFIISFCLVVSAVYSQDSQDKAINHKDSKGRKQGYWKKIEQGAVKYEGNFLDDKPTGEFRYYYPDGKLKALSVFSMKGEISYTTTFHPNGNTMTVGKYVGNERDSIWTLYTEEGKLISEISYRMGKKHGLSRTYFPGGVADEDVIFENDVKEGHWIQYFPDGKKKIKGTYVKGLLQGLLQAFYPSGTVMISGTYKDSLKEGIWMYFDELGKAQKKEIYAGGNKIEEIYFDKKLLEETKRLDSIK